MQNKYVLLILHNKKGLKIEALIFYRLLSYLKVKLVLETKSALSKMFTKYDPD